jgi:hypothetical protein
MTNFILTQEYLHSILDYDSNTGIFVWKKRLSQRAKIGKTAGSMIQGYLEIGIHGKSYKAHRLAWLYVYGVFPKLSIDHINCVPNDNRICNLREANASENGQNRKKLGVHFDKRLKRFCAKLMLNRKTIFCEYFLTEEKANEAYLKAKKQHHPFATNS